MAIVEGENDQDGVPHSIPELHSELCALVCRNLVSGNVICPTDTGDTAAGRNSANAVVSRDRYVRINPANLQRVPVLQLILINYTRAARIARNQARAHAKVRFARK